MLSTHQISRLYLAAMTVDRPCALLFPLRAKSLCTPARTRKMTMILTLIPLLVNISFFFTFKVFVIGTHDEIAILFHPVAEWVTMFFSMYTLFSTVMIPFPIILIGNILIIYGIRKAARNRSKITDGTAGTTTKEKHLTRVLILLSMAFVILCLPLGIYEVLMSIPEVSAIYDLSDPYWKLRVSITYLALSELSSFNHVINFFLYVLGGGKKFRDDTKEVLGICFGRRR